jgi:hypothetical protein
MQTPLSQILLVKSRLFVGEIQVVCKNNVFVARARAMVFADGIAFGLDSNIIPICVA